MSQGSPYPEDAVRPRRINATAIALGIPFLLGAGVVVFCIIYGFWQ